MLAKVLLGLLFGGVGISIGIFAILSEPTPASAKSLGDSPAENARQLIQGYTNWSCATPEPLFVNSPTFALCIQAGMAPKTPHEGGYILVYVNDIGRAAFFKGETLPVGSIVVKEKRWQAASKPVLLTSMIKRAGNGRAGDWDYEAFSGDAKETLTTDWKCANCHQGAGVDHLFRGYLQNPGRGS